MQIRLEVEVEDIKNIEADELGELFLRLDKRKQEFFLERLADLDLEDVFVSFFKKYLRSLDIEEAREIINELDDEFMSFKGYKEKSRDFFKEIE